MDNRPNFLQETYGFAFLSLITYSKGPYINFFNFAFQLYQDPPNQFEAFQRIITY